MYCMDAESTTPRRYRHAGLFPSARRRHLRSNAGNVTYTASNFSLSNAGQSGGGSIYQTGDVDIDISLAGTAMLLQFSKSMLDKPVTSPFPMT